ncbi:hypothetical protein [Streptomyces sp. NPDC048361]|uniref:HAAS signaling domain-containing protein n=1 Tax=Streptomyces sp. NPDC048361 TaxID=3154720 RepID=UPI0034233891
MSTNTTNTLTERYVQEVVRRIPADQRDDIADELRTTIADTVEAHGSADARSAEREVLTEMGDPIRQAARYAGRPLALIGPDYYPAYMRLLTVLLSTVLPAVTIGVMVLDIADNSSLGSAISSGIGTLLMVGSQMIAWLTLVFALVERGRTREGLTAMTTKAWTPDDLPEERQKDTTSVRACVSMAWHALLAGAIVWQHVTEPYRADGADRNGQHLQILDPGLWSGWIWPVLAGLMALVIVELVRIASRGWTVRLACCYAAAQAVFSLPLVWIVYRQMFFNQAFLTDVNKDWTTPNALYNAFAFVVLLSGAASVVRRFRAARG